MVNILGVFLMSKNLLKFCVKFKYKKYDLELDEGKFMIVEVI